TANDRRRRTKSASSARGALTLNSAKFRQASRASSAACSAPTSRSTEASSRSSSVWSQWTAVSAPAAKATRSRYQAATSSSAAGDRRRLVGRQLRCLRDDRLANHALRQPPKRDRLTARADRLRQRAQLVGDEHDHGVRRRLLEIFEQRVSRLLVHRVRPED